MAGFLSEGARDWISLIGLAIGVVQLGAAAVGWWASGRSVWRAAAEDGGSRAGTVLPVSTRVALIAAATSALGAVLASRQTRVVSGMGALALVLGAFVQWVATLNWLADLLPDERFDGSIAELKRILIAVGALGTGCLISAAVLRALGPYDGSSWWHILLSTQATAFISLAGLFGVPFAILETTFWVKHRRETAHRD